MLRRLRAIHCGLKSDFSLRFSPLSSCSTPHPTPKAHAFPKSLSQVVIPPRAISAGLSSAPEVLPRELNTTEASSAPPAGWESF